MPCILSPWPVMGWIIDGALVLVLAVIIARLWGETSGWREGLAAGVESVWLEWRARLSLDLTLDEIREQIRDEERARAWEEAVALFLERQPNGRTMIAAADRLFWRQLRHMSRSLAHTASKELIPHAMRLQEACERQEAVKTRLWFEQAQLDHVFVMEFYIKDLRLNVRGRIGLFEIEDGREALDGPF